MIDDLIECVALAIERTMFAPHELPLDAELHGRYRDTARAAIAAMPISAAVLDVLREARMDVVFMRDRLRRAGNESGAAFRDRLLAAIDALLREEGADG
jgi:hypothetical protein